MGNTATELSATPDDYYERAETQVVLDHERTLHVLVEKGTCKMVLYAGTGNEGGNSAIKLTSVSVKAMKEMVKEHKICVDGYEFKVTDNRSIRSLERILK